MFEDPALSFSLTYLIMYALLASAFVVLLKWIEKNSPFLWAVMALASIAAFVVLIMRLIRLFGNGGNTTPDTTPPGATPPETTPPNATPQQPIHNTITITSPTAGANFNPGDNIRVAFNVAGPEFNRAYDYEVAFNGIIYGGIRHYNARGNQVFPMTVGAGNPPLNPGRHIIQITAYRRGFLRGTNRIIAQSEAVEFTVGAAAPPDDLINLITVNLDSLINDLVNAYNQYYVAFSNVIHLHYQQLRGAGTGPTPQHWAQLLQWRAEIQRIAHEINTLLTAIHTHADYARLTAIHLGVLATLIARDSRVRRAILQFEIQARQDYNARNPPRGQP